MSISSAAGIISLLEEPNDKLKCYALKRLDELVNSFWPEIADVISKIEKLFEDSSFPERNLAALLASKVYYHLGSYKDALLFALGASDLFDVNAHTEYIDTIIAKCIDHYKKLRNLNAERRDEIQEIDPRLEDIVNRMFERCFTHKQYKQAIGIALETRRLDIVQRCINESMVEESSNLLSFTVKSALLWLKSKNYRNEVLRCCVELYSKMPQPDFVNMSQCLIFLEDPAAVADILEKLVKAGPESTLLAFQIAFDLYECATQQFVGKILRFLRQPSAKGRPVSSSEMELEGEEVKESVSSVGISGSGDVQMEDTEKEESKDATDTMHTAVSQPVASSSSESVSDISDKNVIFLADILSGNETIRLHLQFLIRNNHTDMLILKNVKESVRNSVCHTATVAANGFMHVSTTCDDFLRDNLEWVGKATNFAKFSVVASLGVIHKGHENDAMELMKTYLPSDAAAGSPGYMEGGALYGLGMIFANHGDEKIIDYLKNQLSVAQSQNIRHGACLGLGLSAMGSHRQDVYDILKGNLFQDDAVTGEAAGLAMGLVMLGSKSTQAIEDMVAYAQETQHEKILRGLSVGIALLMFGRLEEAEALIESLLRDKDSSLRRSGVYSIALAYCGTGQAEAIRRLLHLAVSDVNNDVKRAAVTSLGLIFFKNPEECPPMVSLLSESFNPHVRYGAAMALGISCAGTANKDAIGLLEAMMSDKVHYVRQGVMIAMALIMIQQNEVTFPKVKDFRATLTKVISDKHEDTIAKFGAIVAQGILDAGGRNVTVSLMSRNGQTDVGAVVGMLVFLQYWYWFPLIHFLALAFKPSCLIGLNSELKMPKINFQSNARPSTYAYTPPLEEKKEKSSEKVETAILSITAKAKKKDKQRLHSGLTGSGGSSDKAVEKMEIDDGSGRSEKDKPKEGEKTDGKEKPKEKEPETSFQMLSNPARVMKQQLKVLKLTEGCRYDPLKNLSIGGIIMMKDTKPEEEGEFVEPVKTGTAKPEEEENEPEPPEPFEYLG